MSDIVIYGKGKIGQSLAKLLQKEQKKFVVYDDENGFECDGFLYIKKYFLLTLYEKVIWE